MALNDLLRIRRAADGVSLEIEIPTGSGNKTVVREGALKHPVDPPDVGALAPGTTFYNSGTGTLQVKDAAGIHDV